MSLNSHFKNIILSSLLDSPAWSHLLDSVLSLAGSGKSFLNTFKLFLGFKDDVAVESLPSPVGEEGFNPIWLDPLPVVELLRTQGFSEDFLSSLEMLPTGVGRLNCSSPYMCFKVFNALGVPRSNFMLLNRDLSFVNNSRRIANFLLLTGEVSFGVYTYKSLSPLRDGDLVYTDQEVTVPVVSFSEEFIDLNLDLPLGVYSIERVNSLYPIWSTPNTLAWVYNGVPSQLVYDRYSPAHIFGTSFLNNVLGQVSLTVSVPASELIKKFWLLTPDVLSVHFSSLSAEVLNSVAIKESLYKTTTSDWIAGGRKMTNFLDIFCIVQWVDMPVFSTSMYAYLFNISDIGGLYEESASLPLAAETPDGDTQLATESLEALAILFSSKELNYMDVSVFLFFKTSEDYSFGFSYGALGETVDFTWVASTKTATLGANSVVLDSLDDSAGLAFNIKDSYVTAQVNGVQVGAVGGFDPLVVFNSFTQNALVYAVRIGRSGVWCTKNGVYVDGVLTAFSSTLSTHKIAEISSLDLGVMSWFIMDLVRYSMPVVLVDTFRHAWSGLEISWDFDIVEPTYFSHKGISLYDSTGFIDSLNNGIINNE